MRRHSIALVTLALLTPLAAGAGDSQQIIVPPAWQGAYDFGYAPAVRVGDWVVVSGIPAGGEGTYEEKIRRMYERAGELLEASGASFADVVELTSFHAESTSPEELQAEFQRYMPIHREFFGDHRPAWTAVGTTTLLSSTAVVELRIVAVAGSGAGATVVPAVGGRVDEVSMEPPAEP